MVSVSRRAGPPHTGHVVFTKLATRPSGEPPCCVISTCAGSTTGSALSGRGTTPPGSTPAWPFSQYTIGIGVPQYLCRLTPQSFSRYVTVAVPNPFASANADIACCAATHDSRSEEHTSELQSLRHLVCRLL